MISSFRATALICQALLFLILSTSAALAHEIRPAIAELSFGNDSSSYKLVIDVNLESLIAEIGPDHEDTDESTNADKYNLLRSMSPDDLGREFQKFEKSFLGNLKLQRNDIKLGRQVTAVVIPEIGDTDLPRDSLVTVSGTLPNSAKSMNFGWDATFGSIVIRTAEEEGDDAYSAFLQNGDSSAEITIAGITVQSAWSVFANYITVGFEHIVPLGLDHILFVIGLFLLSAAIRPLLVQVTSFTLAHTITLALGLFGVLVVPASLVEPLIAISIVYVAVENILFKGMTKWRPLLVFAFGLLHGLGFAGVLSEFGLPNGNYVAGLLGFNLGVEFGQLAVIALCFIFVGFWFGKKPWYRKVVVVPGSLAIALMGAYWVIERTVL